MNSSDIIFTRHCAQEWRGAKEDLLAWNHCPTWTWMIWVFRKFVIRLCTSTGEVFYDEIPEFSSPTVVAAIGATGIWCCAIYHPLEGWILYPSQISIVDRKLVGGYFWDGSMLCRAPWPLDTIWERWKQQKELEEEEVNYYLYHFMGGSRIISLNSAFIGYEMVRYFRRNVKGSQHALFGRDMQVLLPSESDLVDYHPHGKGQIEPPIQGSENFAVLTAYRNHAETTYHQEYFLPCEEGWLSSWYWTWTRFGGLVSPTGERVIHPLSRNRYYWNSSSCIGAMEDFRGHLWFMDSKGFLTRRNQAV